MSSHVGRLAVIQITVLIFLTLLFASCSTGRVPASQYCGLFSMPMRTAPVTASKPYLGVYLGTATAPQPQSGCTGSTFVQVAGVINGTPAKEAGIQEGDIILTLNKIPTCLPSDNVILSFKKNIEHQAMGVPLPVEILRKDKRLTLTLSLISMPTHSQPEAQHPELATCPEAPSQMTAALASRQAGTLYDRIIQDLTAKSNSVHNPGSEYEKTLHPLQLNEVTYLMRHPLAAGEVATGLSQRMTAPLERPNRDIGSVVEQAASLLDIELASRGTQTEISFPALLRAMEEAKNSFDKAFAYLTPEQRELIQKNAASQDDDKQWSAVFELAMKFNRAEVFNAVAPLLSFLRQDNLELLRQDLVSRFGGNAGPILHEEITPFGKVLVGGTGPNVYREDAALILDLGGDDIYLNNAGGTRNGMPVALVVDWGGDDHYLSTENFSQGAGVLGAGILLDLGGHDTFTALDSSQGTGFWGIGILSHGDGGSLFNARKHCQGAAQMGIGILLNGSGNDTYTCSLGGQGYGLIGGAGALIDEAGNDRYQLGGLEPDFRDPARATQSFGQGFGMGSRPDKDKQGIPGGVGMLIDKQGDDMYIADYFGQGASYYYGLGILDDRAGSDQYLCGRYCQGAGIHSTVGVLIDRAGDDFYYASFGVAQGVGHDYGIGFLEDGGGRNRYQGGALVQGASTNGGIGMLIAPRFPADGSPEPQFSVEENSMGIRISRQGPSGPTVSLGVKK